MKCFFTFAVATALASGIAANAWSQGGQGGGGGTSGSVGASDTAAAGRAQIGAAQAQPGANVTGQGQLGATAQVGGDFNGIDSTPFFTDPGVRQQLHLNDNQFNQLSRAHQQALLRFNQGAGGLGNNVTPQQRALRMHQLRGTFDTEFGTTLDTTFTDPRFRQRFNQLHWQHQGLGAFNDPVMQRQLNLTPDQRRQMMRLAGEWRQQLNQLRRASRTDPALTQQGFNTMRAQYMDQVNAILTPVQQQTWTRLIGQQYDFPMQAYLQQYPNRSGNVGIIRSGQNPGAGRRIVPHGGAAQGTQGQNQVR